MSASVAVLLSILLAGCASFQSDDRTANGAPVARLSQNNPTDVDLRYDDPVPRDMMLDMQVDFALRNQAEFDELSREIDDPNSPHYQQWLTPQEMHARFGETKDQFEAVEAWLKSEGFAITEERYGSERRLHQIQRDGGADREDLQNQVGGADVRSLHEFG